MDKYFDTDGTEEYLNLEMCSIFTPPVCVAKAAPVPITSADELENWLAQQRMPVGTIDQIPQTWCGAFLSLPQGFVARMHGSGTRLFRFLGKEMRPYFPDKEPLPQGQIFFLADAS